MAKPPMGLYFFSHVGFPGALATNVIGAHVLPTGLFPETPDQKVLTKHLVKAYRELKGLNSQLILAQGEPSSRIITINEEATRSNGILLDMAAGSTFTISTPGYGVVAGLSHGQAAVLVLLRRTAMAAMYRSSTFNGERLTELLDLIGEENLAPPVSNKDDLFGPLLGSSCVLLLTRNAPRLRKRIANFLQAKGIEFWSPQCSETHDYSLVFAAVVPR